MNNYFITVSNGIYSPDHYKKIGPSLWLFIWYLDKVTIITKDQEGIVLGGKPIKARDYAKIIGVSEKTFFRDNKRLEDQGYIKTTRTPYGFVVKVKKCKKFFSKKDNTVPGDQTKVSSLSPSPEIETRQKCPVSPEEKEGTKNKAKTERVDTSVQSRVDTSVHSNKIIQLDNTNNTLAEKKSPRTKKEKKGEPDPQKELYKRLLDFWHVHVQKTRGLKPEYSDKDRGSLKSLLKRTPLKEEDTQKIMLFFLADPSYRKLGPSLSTFCSKGVQTSLINDFKNNPHFFKKLYEYADRYMQAYKPPTEQEHKDFSGRLIQLRELLTQGFLDKINTGR